ncbi:hypothetical protein CC86DRAFT_386623 [Ophiobolus disseminans]|uniref:Uncharacterized protein n=1 Tax=Ophiobolus disseminans TaxID=1469910 RepID=A0A6A6ZLF9_9PLEO|nr:hypothetical protein CC86DRAFT_386623 [Ophiobolus disseminans]
MPVDHRFFGLDREIAQIEFNKTIAGCYRDGNAEYESVGVLLITWKEDDMRCKEREVNTLEQVFKDKFNFKTEQYEIPPTNSEQSLFSRLRAFNSCYDSPAKLGIIYYGGHAERKESEDGVDLEIFARQSTGATGPTNLSRQNTSLNDISLPSSPIDVPEKHGHAFPEPRPEQPHISFRAIKEQIRAAETDMLIIVDSCFAAGAFTDQLFGGRKCELFCSIAEKDVARAPGQDGSFTRILTTTLEKMIQDLPEGFSTSDLFRELYLQQHKAHKPAYFTQSRFDFGRIWLRPCRQKATLPSPDSKYSIDVRFHLTKSLDLTELNKVVKALQWIPFVRMVKMQSMHSPNDDLSEFIRTIHLANRLRPLLARIRRKLELKRARQLFRTDSTLSSSSSVTSERFHVHEPRDVGLFDWSNAQAVTPRHEHLTSDEYFHLEEPFDSEPHSMSAPSEPSKAPSLADITLQPYDQGPKADNSAETTSAFFQYAASIFSSPRALDRLLFFSVGVLAPTLVRWAVHGSASPFAAP